ncbi:MAG: aldo/keto reductase [Mycobacteriales bacterium]
MEERRVGTSGLSVSRLALGTMTWGRDTDADDAVAQLRAFRDVGGTLLDTADVYGGGASETVVGELLRDLVPRDEIVLATKAFGRTAHGGMGRGSSRGHLLAALDASLKRLGTDHVDLWQLHAYDADVPLAETLAALDAAVASGKARYVGVSNFCGWQLATAATWQRAAGGSGHAPIVADQVEYSLLQRGIEREVVPAAAHAGVGLLPWSPLGRGVLTGKYRHGRPADSRAASASMSGFVKPYLTDAAGRVVEAVATAADGLGVTPVAVALAWVRDQPGVAAPIVGARTVAQLKASLESETVDLPDEIAHALDDVSRPPAGYPEAR